MSRSRDNRRLEGPSATAASAASTDAPRTEPARGWFYREPSECRPPHQTDTRAFIGVSVAVGDLPRRPISSNHSAPRGGTESPSGCFFSPDGRSLGFTTSSSNALKKLSLADGQVVPLAGDIDMYSGGTWGPDDRITFARAGALWQVPAAGGAATQVTQLDRGKGELSHLSPTVVADGKVILFTVVTGSGRAAAHIEALTLATGQRQVLVDPGTFPLYAPSGHLIFSRNDALLAAALDVDRLSVTGPPTRVIENLAVDNTGAPVSALSNTVPLCILERKVTSRCGVSRQGLEQPCPTPR